MTYSQYGQDDEIVSFFGGKETGWYIDVGAHIDGNDTLLLEEKGWNGICIEPHDHNFKFLAKKRNCLCLNVCVGDKSGEIDFFENNGYTNALSGVMDYYCEEHKERIQTENQHYGGSSSVVKKNIKTLTQILDEVKAPNYIELLKIDVEGGEYAVLSGIDFSKYSFGLITLEANYSHELSKCESILNEKGYSPFKRIGIDVFFVPNIRIS